MSTFHLPSVLRNFLKCKCGEIIQNRVSGEEIRVQTTHGPVVGYRRESSTNYIYISFKGIPYAMPPVGPLRFKVITTFCFHHNVRLGHFHSKFRIRSHQYRGLIHQGNSVMAIRCVRNKYWSAWMLGATRTVCIWIFTPEKLSPSSWLRFWYASMAVFSQMAVPVMTNTIPNIYCIMILFSLQSIIDWAPLVCIRTAFKQL